MNEDPEHASAWVGRILMHTQCISDQQPILKVEQIDDTIKQMAADLGFFQEKEYSINLHVEEGENLPSFTTSYTVKIKVAEHEFETKEPEEQWRGHNRWNHSIQ